METFPQRTYDPGGWHWQGLMGSGEKLVQILNTMLACAPAGPG